VAPEKRRPHDHADVESICVMEGTLSVHIDGGGQALDAGDAMYFDASIPHAYRRSGGRLCSALIVTAS
jgi:quercetin dioxygenase-like cupin family protein